MTAFLPTLVPHALRRVATRLLLLGTLLALPAWAAPPFTDNGDGTVTDGTTHLMWDQCAYGLTGATCTTGTALQTSWAGALDAAVAANNANYKGFNDWRVPNKNELESLVNLSAVAPRH